jgi:hypothetical protein
LHLPVRTPVMEALCAPPMIAALSKSVTTSVTAEHTCSVPVVSRVRFMMRSAWLKWARSVEHQKSLAAETRQRDHLGGYNYERTDNLGDATDPLVRMHWRLRVTQPYPERWGVLLGDSVTNLRASLDHAFWAAVHAHSGPPSNPSAVTFPISPTAEKYKRPTRELRPLVASQIWDVVDAVQPHYGDDRAHTAPLEILRFLSNHDKHRTVQIVGRNSLQLVPIDVRSDVPIDIVEQWQREGPTGDGDVVARLKFRRSVGDRTVDVTPTMAHEISVQISDEPVEYRPLGELMDVIRDRVLKVLIAFDTILGEEPPEGLELGDHFDAINPQGGGDHIAYTDADGKSQRWSVPVASTEIQEVDD